MRATNDEGTSDWSESGGAGDTTGPSPTFSPTDGATVTDAAGNITLGFAEEIRKDAGGTALQDSDLADLLTLRRTDATGTAITFTATLNAAKTGITIDPSSDLPDGAVYVAISDDYFDAHGNRGSAAAATFTVDTSVAAPTFRPADGDTVSDAAGNITLGFAEALRKDAGGTALQDSDLAGILTLKRENASGAAVAFTATIDSNKRVITIDPSSDLADGKVYVAITSGYFDAHGNRGSAAEATFTVDTTGPSPTFSPADGDTVTGASGNITLGFAEALRKDAVGGELANADLAGILTLKTDDADGTDIGFAATIDSNKRVITIDPSSDLADGAVYMAITNGYFDAAGNRGSAASATFTVDTTGADARKRVGGRHDPDAHLRRAAGRGGEPRECSVHGEEDAGGGHRADGLPERDAVHQRHHREPDPVRGGGWRPTPPSR